MTLRIYSSLTAFLAHYDALRRRRPDGFAATLAADAAARAEIDGVIDELGDADRAALADEPASVANAASAGAAARHRTRAELKLRRLLIARGMLSG
jgi:hypothetical protein